MERGGADRVTDLAAVPLDPGADPALCAALVALQRASYRVEAELIGSEAIPALHDTPATLVATDPTWLGCQDADGPAGTIACTHADGETDVDRLVVAPRAFRRGIGRKLVAAVVDRAAGGPVTVSTGRANAPARALYRLLGFREDGEYEVEPGLWVSYRRDATSSTSKASEFSR